MPAPFQCSECGFATNVKDELAGKKIRCPKCKAAGVVGKAGAASGGKPKSAKPANTDDSEADLLSVNLESFQDVEVPEGEVLDESLKPKAPKAKKKKKGAPLDPQVKMMAIAFSLLSVLVIAGLVYTLGPTVSEEIQNFASPKEEPAGGKPAGENAGGAQ